jgi:hypothetical protein
MAVNYSEFLKVVDAEDDRYWSDKFTSLRMSLIVILNNFDDSMIEALHNKGASRGKPT